MRRMIAAGPSAKRPPHRAFGPAAPGPARSRSPGSDPGGAGRLLASFGTVAVALLLAVGAALAAEPDLKPGEFIAASPPQPAPELSFQDLSGNWVALADFKGKLVLLNLWATWCQPCLKEMPSLEKLQGSREDKLTVGAASATASDRKGTSGSWVPGTSSTGGRERNSLAKSSGAISRPE